MNLDRLRQRADLLKQLRDFFYRQGFWECETPVASDEVIPERHIAPVEIEHSKRYLQASPELHMKQLLCRQSGPIFQVTRAFREDELGDLHLPEFTMIEWYRPGDDMQKGIGLLVELIQNLLSISEVKQTSYREAFQRTLSIDPHAESTAGLRRLVKERTAYPVEENNASLSRPSEERDELLNVLLSQCVEPLLGKEGAEILYLYPASQSALAKTTIDDQGIPVAERFELYVKGVELANGYHELTDADELEHRLREVNSQRESADMPALPMPERLLTAMRSPGLPASAGVALGFDRLVMLATGAKSIAEVVAFPEA